MHQRNSLIIAIALSAFILVLIGSLAARLSQQPSVAAVAASSDTAVPPTIALDPSTEALLAEREAAYQQALAEANQRIAQANEQVAQANARLQQASAPVAAGPAAAAPAYAISSAQAQAIAEQAAAGAPISRGPELVSYEGQPAYEITFNHGAVYVDANTGALLSNTASATIAQQISAEQAAQTAVAYRGSGEVREVELEHERGALVYAVKFSDGATIFIDAASGQVVYAQLGGDEAHERDEGGEDDD